MQFVVVGQARSPGSSRQKCWLMSIFQFVWQVLLLCGIGVAVLFGLFSAPWYVLGLFLLVALGLTWKLMPSPQTWIAPAGGEVVQSSAIAHQTGNLSSAPTEKRYRGAQYPTASPSVAEAPAQPAVLSYRGAAYAPKAAAKPPISSSATPPELKYRGAKIPTPPSPPA